jgi:hypothetical protein
LLYTLREEGRPLGIDGEWSGREGEEKGLLELRGRLFWLW